MQISSDLSLIGLLAKNAHLFSYSLLSSVLFRTGLAIKYDDPGPGARLPPYPDDLSRPGPWSLPPTFASGLGHNRNHTSRPPAAAGLFIGTLCQIFWLFFAVSQWLQEKLTPMKFEDEMNEEVAAELEQYANAAHQGYREEVITQCNFKGNNEKESKYHHHWPSHRFLNSCKTLYGKSELSGCQDQRYRLAIYLSDTDTLAVKEPLPSPISLGALSLTDPPPVNH